MFFGLFKRISHYWILDLMLMYPVRILSELEERESILESPFRYLSVTAKTFYFIERTKNIMVVDTNKTVHPVSGFVNFSLT